MDDSVIEAHGVHGMLIDAFLSMEIVCAPVVIYLAIFKSRPIRRYRFYILNNAIWNLAADLVVWLGGVRFYFPKECVAFYSLIPLHRDVVPLVIFLYWVCIANMDFGVVWCLLYRFAYAMPGFLRTIFDESKYAWTFIMAAEVVVIVPYASLILFFRRSPEQDALVEQIGSPSGAFCFAGGYNFRLASYCMSVMLVGIFAFGVTLYCILFRTVVMNRSIASSKTQNLQVNLVKAMGVQTMIAYAFLLLPKVLFWYTVAAEWPSSGKIAAFATTLASMHGPVDCISLMYCIKPYRRTVTYWFRMRPESEDCSYGLSLYYNHGGEARILKAVPRHAF